MTNYGICLQSIASIRKAPGEKNEMVNQLLFGDMVAIKDAHEGWYLIEGMDDHYEGWADQKQIHRLHEGAYRDINSRDKAFIDEITAACTNLTDQTTHHLVRGSRIPLPVNNRFEIDRIPYIIDSSSKIKPESQDKNKVAETAIRFLNAPYLWGGRTPFGIDCSGFTQIVYKICGYQLPRDASQQVDHGTSIDFVHEALPGDLAFFGNQEGEIVHTGIILENQKIIHASGKVRIDILDHQGIYNEQQNEYTHTLRVIKRIP